MGGKTLLLPSTNREDGPHCLSGEKRRNLPVVDRNRVKTGRSRSWHKQRRNAEYMDHPRSSGNSAILCASSNARTTSGLFVPSSFVEHMTSSLSMKFLRLIPASKTPCLTSPVIKVSPKGLC